MYSNAMGNEEDSLRVKSKRNWPEITAVIFIVRPCECDTRK
jgi:hypothetical protein